MTNKDRRKQIREELRLKAQQELDRGLPMYREKFKELFDHLDITLNEQGCDDDHALTISFLKSANVQNTGDVIAWLKDHGGYCDCEVLANVEEIFE